MGEMTKGLSGGSMVLASTLSVGDTIRDSKLRKRIMIVEEAGNEVFVRGLESGQTGQHRFIKGNEMVEKVTNASTPDSVL